MEVKPWLPALAGRHQRAGANAFSRCLRCHLARPLRIRIFANDLHLGG